MANPTIVQYLQGNRSKYPVDALKKRLLESGYPANEIDTAVAEVFGGAAPAPVSAGTRSFFDFRTPRTYVSFGKKLGDFLFGFFGVFVVNIVLGGFVGSLLGIMVRSLIGYGSGYSSSLPSLGPLLGVGLLIIEIWLIFYFWKRRHYLARGILFALLLPLILIVIGIALYLLFLGGRLWY